MCHFLYPSLRESVATTCVIDYTKLILTVNDFMETLKITLRKQEIGLTSLFTASQFQIY